jgi:MFS family permease
MLLNSDLTPPSRRGAINSLLSVSWGAGCVLGGFFGGVVNDTWGWRTAFLVQVPPCFVVAILAATLVKIPPKTSRSGLSRLARIDFTGAALVVVGLLLFQVPLNAGGIILPWAHPAIWVSMALSVVVMAALVWWELHTRYPMIPVRMLSNRTVVASSLAACLAVYSSFTWTFFIPLFFQVFGMTAAKAGLRLLVTAVGVSVGGVLGGWAINKVGYRIVGVVSALISGAGIAIMTIADDLTPRVGYGGHWRAITSPLADIPPSGSPGWPS